jgi:hypothetical protein
MRIGTLVLIVWLVIGAIAGGQRHYYTVRLVQRHLRA